LRRFLIIQSVYSNECAPPASLVCGSSAAPYFSPLVILFWRPFFPPSYSLINLALFGCAPTAQPTCTHLCGLCCTGC